MNLKSSYHDAWKKLAPALVLVAAISLTLLALVGGQPVLADSPAFQNTPLPTPALVPLCADAAGVTNTIVRASVPADSSPRASIFCRVLMQNGVYVQNASLDDVGSASIAQFGMVQAVDVFAIRTTGETIPRFLRDMTVCLWGSGGIIYLDAAQTPRQPQWLPTTTEGDYTCAAISNPGTVVLVSSLPPAPTAAPDAPPQALTGCEATVTVDGLRFRKAPDTASKIIDLFLDGQKLEVLARQGLWLQVKYKGLTGWVNSSFVLTSGTCR